MPVAGTPYSGGSNKITSTGLAGCAPITKHYTITNNLWFGGNESTSPPGERVTDIDASPILGNPNFVSVPPLASAPAMITATDFRLNSGSPAINAGSSAVLVPIVTPTVPVAGPVPLPAASPYRGGTFTPAPVAIPNDNDITNGRPKGGVNDIGAYEF